MSAFPFSVQDVARPQPVLTDRHGNILLIGDEVLGIKRNRLFRITETKSFDESFPTVFMLRGETKRHKQRIVSDASLTMFRRRRITQLERADFCEKCYNHYRYEEIDDHACPWVKQRARRKCRFLALMWCVPRLLRWKHRALQYYQGSLATLRAEGVADHGSFM